MITKLHLSPAQGQELAAAEPIERGTLKTESANHCHTEVHTQQERPPLKSKKRLLLLPIIVTFTAGFGSKGVSYIASP